MRGTRHVLATLAAAGAVIQPAVLAQGTPLKPGLHPGFCWNAKGSNAGSRDPQGCCSDVAQILGHALGSRPNLGRGSGA